MITLISWNEFWSKIGEFLATIWNNLYAFWIDPQSKNPDSTEFPYLATFIFGLIFLVLGYFVIKLIIKILHRALKLDHKSFIKERSLKSFLVNAIKYILYVLLILIFFSILGISMSGFSEIISSAILAIGLSLQDVVGNFASGLIILTSKPFVIGDYILFNEENVEGNVIEVKFLTTILNTPNNQIVVIPNRNVTNAILTNFSTNKTRRVNIEVSVAYETNIEEAKKIIVNAIKTEKRVLDDPAPVAYLVNFNESNLIVSCRCYTLTEDYWDVLYNLNEIILSYFKNNDIKFGVRRIDIIDSSNRKLKDIEINK